MTHWGLPSLFTFTLVKPKVVYLSENLRRLLTCVDLFLEHEAPSFSPLTVVLLFCNQSFNIKKSEFNQKKINLYVIKTN